MSYLKKSLSVVSKYEAFYTGGRVQITSDGQHLFCPCGWKIKVVECHTGKIVKSFGQEDEDITCFCLSPDDQFLIVATQQLVFRQWDWKSELLTRSWRAVHVGPVSCMTFDTTSTLLATGSSDTTIKVWDIVEQYCTHNFRGHTGVISTTAFHSESGCLRLVSASDDYKVRIWDLTSSKCVAVVDAHYSQVTSFVFSPDGKTMYSGGRDSVLVTWNTENWTVKTTIPVFESVEALMFVRDGEDYSSLGLTDMDSPHLFITGSRGTLRIVNAKTGKCVHSRQVALMPGDSDEENQVVTQAMHCTSINCIVIVTYDHNIIFLRDNDLSQQKQLCGNSDEFLDIQFVGERETHLVAASNSEKVKVFNRNTWACQMVEGHKDIVLAVDVYTKLDLVATSSKDSTVRLWKFRDDISSLECIGVASGHVQSVNTIAFSRKTPSFLVSGSQDCTVKVWTLPMSLDVAKEEDLMCRATEKGHDKDINCVVVSPNDKFIATASQDKTAKLWKASSLSLVGVFRGHSRGIWCVQFSPVDQCLATSSTDGTIRIWSLSDFSCVKTFEGHDASVLKVTFVSRGMQLLSVGSDGLFKLWTIKTNECVKTFDEHDAKVWSVACSRDEVHVVTADADSTLILWRDVSEEEEEETLLQQEQQILQQQELSNLIHEKQYLKAIGLAITLEQPYRLMSILKELLFDVDGRTRLEETLAKLRPDQIDAILRFSTQWNTNSKHCHLTQLLLRVVLQTRPSADVCQLTNIKSTVEGLLPYTERHFQRLSRLYQQSKFVDYTWHCMRTVSTSGPTPETVPAIEGGDVLFRIDKGRKKSSSSSSSESESESESEDSSDEVQHIRSTEGDELLDMGTRPGGTEKLPDENKNFTKLKKVSQTEDKRLSAGIKPEVKKTDGETKEKLKPGKMEKRGASESQPESTESKKQKLRNRKQKNSDSVSQDNAATTTSSAAVSSQNSAQKHSAKKMSVKRSEKSVILKHKDRLTKTGRKKNQKRKQKRPG